MKRFAFATQTASVNQTLLWLLNHQYGKLVLGATLLGMAFGVGFVTGRSGRRIDTQSASSLDALNAFAEKEKAYAQIQRELKLTYYKELLSQPKTSPSELFVSIETVKTAPTPSQIVEPIAEELLLNQELENAPKPNTVSAEKPSGDRMARALANVLGKETPGPVTDAIKSSLPTSTGSAFAIQIASLPDRTAAEEIVRKWRNKGFAARLVQADIVGKGMVYRVRLHGFKTRDEAEEFRQKNKLDGISVAQ